MEFKFNVKLDDYENYYDGNNGAKNMVDDIMDRAVDIILRENNMSYSNYTDAINQRLDKVIHSISKDIVDIFTDRKQNIIHEISDNVIKTVTAKIERSKVVTELIESYNTHTDSAIKKDINNLIKDGVKEEVRKLIKF